MLDLVKDDSNLIRISYTKIGEVVKAYHSIAAARKTDNDGTSTGNETINDYLYSINMQAKKKNNT